MFTLLGLLCFDPANSETCSTQMYGQKGQFPTEQACMEFGATQVGVNTPYGIVVEYNCRDESEPV